MQAEFERFFDRYVEAYNRSLAGEVQHAAIRQCFADCFVGAGPGGSSCGRNDESFTKALDEAYAFYRTIGTKRMSVRRVQPTPIDASHFLVRVFYSADYEKPDGSGVTLEFDVAYLIEVHGEGPRIFAFVTGDEMAAYREHGLV